MIVAEDWELNYRSRPASRLIWFTPELKVTYRPRATLATLAHQRFPCGRWRRVVARRYPETVNRRYLAPPVATTLNAGGCPGGGRPPGRRQGQQYGLRAWHSGCHPGRYLAGRHRGRRLVAADLPPGTARVPGRHDARPGGRVPHQPPRLARRRDVATRYGRGAA